MEDDLTPIQRDLSSNTHLTAQHAAHVDDLENRLWSNYVHAIGIQEKAEGENTVAFFEKRLVSVFRADAFSPMFSVERAHMVPARPPPPGANPRPFLFKLLKYKDWDSSLSKASIMSGMLAIDNSKDSPFLDFSAELQNQRAKFTDVKRCPRSLEL